MNEEKTKQKSTELYYNIYVIILCCMNDTILFVCLYTRKGHFYIKYYTYNIITMCACSFELVR